MSIFKYLFKKKFKDHKYIRKSCSILTNKILDVNVKRIII